RSVAKSAGELLGHLELESLSVWDKVVAICSRTLFAPSRNVDLDDAVRLTHIAAALNARIPHDFRYFTRDGKLRGQSDDVFHGEDGFVEHLFPSAWYEQHALHEKYAADHESCNRTQ